MTRAPPGDAPLERRIELPFALGVSRAPELRAALLAALDEDVTVVLDASEVDSADTLGLQLVLAFVRSATARGRPWRWGPVSRSLRRVADQCGVSERLGLSGGAP